MTTTTGHGVDRRDFLKGAGLSAVGLAAAGALAACSPSTPSDGGGSGGGAATGSTSSGGSGGATTKPVGGAICPEDWLGTMPEITNAEDGGTFDVVILGGGHAGTQAACAAAQAGASVVVVEKQPEDSYVYFGDDIGSYNSQFMIAKGFGPYDTGEIVSEYCRRGLGRVNPQIVKLYVENSGEVLDNFVAVTPDTSDAFDDGRYIIQIAYGKDKGSDYPLEQSGYKAWATTLQTIGTVNQKGEVVPGRVLSRLTELETYVMREAQSKGATWLWGHSAAALLMDGDAVVGAYAETPEGGYVKLTANKGVILACGDFSSNPDMVYNLLDDVSEWGTRVGQDRTELAGMGRDGMGQKLGCWAGGAMEPHPRPSMNTMGGTPGPWGTTAFLCLNKDGERFMNEAMAQLASGAVIRQPLGLLANITDSKYMKQIQSAGLDHGAPNWGYPQIFEQLDQEMQAMTTGPEGANIVQTAIINLGESGSFAGGGGADMMPEEGEGEEGDEPAASPFGSGPNVWKADTVEELLGYLGFEGAALANAAASVNRYNELCAAGKDTDFDKDPQLLLPINEPPFYGSCSQLAGTSSAGLVTLAGLLTDTNLNVMKADRTGPIKGLYAAGNCLGQRYGMGYSTPSAGNSMGMAMTHGRVVGKIVAAL
jgi:succinate dehydrogenase/fumarate reductase flavoprotein subunit